VQNVKARRRAVRGDSRGICIKIAIRDHAITDQNVSKDEIRQIQEALNQKGFKAGPADGVLGPETKNALKEFQQKQGFNATGELGQPDDERAWRFDYGPSRAAAKRHRTATS
jgi:peptidoglycan hydrolase-like protein with peptidoglycan-binding domain